MDRSTAPTGHDIAGPTRPPSGLEAPLDEPSGSVPPDALPAAGVHPSTLILAGPAVLVTARFRGVMLASRLLSTGARGRRRGPASFNIGVGRRSDAPVNPAYIGGGVGGALHPLVEETAAGWALKLTPAMSAELPSAGSLVRVPCGEMVFEIDAATTEAPLPRPWLSPGFRREGAFLLVAAAVFLLGLAALYAIPADPKALSLDDIERSRRMVRLQIVPPAPPPEVVAAGAARESLPASGSGGASAGPAGRAGDRRARPVPGRLAVRGPADNPDPRLIARQLAERIAHTGLLGQLRAAAGSALASVLADGPALGRDAETVLGNLASAEIAAAYGTGGLSDRGTGASGADTGRPILGLGELGTNGRFGGGPGTRDFGPGGPGGPGAHYGTEVGGLGRHVAAVPSLIPGRLELRGALDKEIVRRIVRRHVNEVRYCYEGELVRRPALAGRLVVEFAISGTGQVISSVVQSSTLKEPHVESCVTQAVRRWEFPQPSGGGLVIVSYPFQFQPAGGL